jgi:hypothetical protein
VTLAFPTWITDDAAWHEDVIFLLDDELRFVDCNPAWDEFSVRNGGKQLLRADVAGRMILDFVPDVLRNFYVQKYWFAKRSSGWTETKYDCSSPEKIRLFRMAMIRSGECLLVVNHLLLEEECRPGPPLTEEGKRSYVSSGGFITMCASCRKTKRSGGPIEWEWIPDFLRDHSLTVSHGLCPRCLAYLYN